MAVRCNNCGAPLIVPQDERPYAVCSYCQSATELPKRRQRRERKQQAAPAPPAASSSPVVKVVLGLLVAGGIAAAASGAWFVFQANRPLPSALPPGATENAATSGVRVLAFESSDASVETTRRERSSSAPTATTTARKAARPTDAGAGKPSPTSALSPTSTASPEPRAPEPPPKPKPKNLRVSIGNIALQAGKYPMATLKSRMATAQGPVRTCYAGILEEKPDTEGTLNMRLQIAPPGTTRGVGVTGSFLPSNLISCVNRVFSAVTFPPTEGESVNVGFTVKLSAD